jgi:hypothetical protein
MSTGQVESKTTPAIVSLNAETVTAASPTTVASPARGTTARFTTMPIVETWLKCASVIGSTASCAARLTPMALAT